jgi:hypothetical protein
LFRKEINDLHRKKQTSKESLLTLEEKHSLIFLDGDFEDNSLRIQISILQNVSLE